MTSEEKREKQRASSAKYRATHPDRVKASKAAFRAANPNYNRAAFAKWKAAHPEMAGVREARFRAAHPERVAQIGAKCRAEHPGTRREWRAANPERVKAMRARWAKAHPEQIRAKGHRRRVLLREGIVETFLDTEIFERDGWTCGICLESIDQQLRYPHSMSVSLDHVVPIAKGGHHTRVNVQAAHFGCNSGKRDQTA